MGAVARVGGGATRDCGTDVTVWRARSAPRPVARVRHNNKIAYVLCGHTATVTVYTVHGECVKLKVVEHVLMAGFCVICRIATDHTEI